MSRNWLLKKKILLLPNIQFTKAAAAESLGVHLGCSSIAKLGIEEQTTHIPSVVFVIGGGCDVAAAAAAAAATAACNLLRVQGNANFKSGLWRAV